MASPYLPRRIASLQPSATVILAALGELDRLIACTRYCLDVVPELANASPTIVADSWSVEAEQIVNARPDLVIAAVPYQEKTVVEILKAGARFLGLAPKSLADIYSDIATIAGVVGALDRGVSTIAHMERRILEVRTRTRPASRPRVFCEEWGKPVIASQHWVAELVEAAGGEFIGAPGRHFEPQEVVDLAPDVIVAAWCGAGDRVPLEKIILARGWEATEAALHGNVYCIRDEFLNTPAPTLLEGLDALAFAIHPELFPCPKGIRRITGISATSMSNARP